MTIDSTGCVRGECVVIFVGNLEKKMFDDFHIRKIIRENVRPNVLSDLKNYTNEIKAVINDFCRETRINSEER